MGLNEIMLKPPMEPPPRRAEQGIALIAVLWLLSALTMIAVLVAALSLNHLRAIHAVGEVVEAESAADSAIRLALLHLAAPEQRESWTAPQSRQINLFGWMINLKIESESGRLDLNTGDRQLLVALFAANGWSQTDAEAFVARIEDWTDPDDDPAEGGAEVRQYLAAGRNYGPRNAPFESVEELRQVLGSARVSTGIFESLSVYTHARLPDRTTAVPAVKRALAWADLHRLGDHSWLASSHPSSGATLGATTAFIAGQVVRVRACAKSQQTSHCRLAIARITGNPGKPFEILVWRATWQG